MARWIVLFRGINVGGNNILPMKELAALLEEIGCTKVKTYIQSGNVVLDAPLTDARKLAARVEKAVADRRGFKPQVFALTLKELAKAAAGNPFRKAETKPASLHLFFMAEKPKAPDHASIQAAKARSEELVIKDRVCFLHAPDGIGRSKLAGRVEKFLGVALTGRNWATVSKLIEMAEDA